MSKATLKKPVKAASAKAAKADTSTKKAKLSVVKGKDKKAAKAKPEKAKTEKAKIEIGQILEFTGYVTEQDDPMFEAGDKVKVVDIEKDENGTTLYSCIKADDAEAYDEDPDSVEGDQLVAKELKAGKSKAVAKAAPEPVKVVNVGDMSKILKKGDYIEVAHSLIDNINQNFFYLGGVLAHIFFENVFKETHEDWDAFCQENFGFKGRKGRYWIDIYLTYSQLPGFDVKQLPDIGWSKAAELARYITEENQDELVELAKESNITDLKATLKTDYTSEGVTSSGRQASRSSGKVKRVTYSFKLFEDQAEGVNLVLDEARKVLGIDDLNQVFEQIVMGWASENLSEAKAKKAQKLSAKAAKSRETEDEEAEAA